MLLAWLATSFLPSISTSGCGLPAAKMVRPPGQKKHLKSPTPLSHLILVTSAACHPRISCWSQICSCV